MKKDVLANIFWFTFAIYLSVESYRLGLGEWGAPGPGYFPFGAAIVFGIISGFILVNALLKGHLKKIPLDSQERLHWQNIIWIMLGMLAYILLFTKIGFVLCTFSFILVCIHVVARQPWFGSSAIAIVTTLAFYVAFKILLNIPLPKGFFIF